MTHRTQPTAHQTLRDDVADVLAEADGWRWAPGFKRDSPTYLGYQERADAVLAVIPASDRPHVIREAIERVEDPEERAKSPIGLGLGWESAREVLRRMLHQAVGEQIVRPKTPTVDPAERRARYTEPLFAIMRQNGWDGERTEQGNREMDLVIDAILTVADAEQFDLRRERDLAIAHDRQPYPTAWAYEKACAALRRKTEAIERVLEWAAGLDDVARQVAGTDATHPVAAHIRHLLDTQQDGAQGPFRAGSSWTIETHRRGSWQRWMPDRDNPDEARQEYLRVITGSGSRWAFRLVRADTKYTVEAEHNPGGEPVVDVRPTDTARSDQDPAQDLASADNPTHLRWGLNDVLHGDDDTVTVLLSGPDLEAYWLELDQERAAALREDLASPDGPAATPNRAAVLREAADECDKAGAAYTARAQNEHAAGAFALMETFLRKADEAEYVATPCDFAACEPGGEPCSVHERLMAHAEGDHELCKPDCGPGRLADEEQQQPGGTAFSPGEGVHGRDPYYASSDTEAQQQAETQAHPRRGDEFEAWLKAQRDLCFGHASTWGAVDGLLDQYRLHADTGTPLGEHVCEGKAVGDCDCLETAAAAPVAGQPPADRLHCPRCQEDITDYAEDDLVFRTGDERPYCSGECVVAAHRAGLPTEQPPADTGEEAQPRFVRVCIACPQCDHTLDEDGACANGCHVPAAVVAEPGKENGRG